MKALTTQAFQMKFGPTLNKAIAKMRLGAYLHIFPGQGPMVQGNATNRHTVTKSSARTGLGEIVYQKTVAGMVKVPWGLPSATN